MVVTQDTISKWLHIVIFTLFPLLIAGAVVGSDHYAVRSYGVVLAKVGFFRACGSWGGHESQSTCTWIFGNEGSCPAATAVMYLGGISMYVQLAISFFALFKAWSMRSQAQARLNAQLQQQNAVDPNASTGPVAVRGLVNIYIVQCVFSLITFIAAIVLLYTKWCDMAKSFGAEGFGWGPTLYCQFGFCFWYMLAAYFIMKPYNMVLTEQLPGGAAAVPMMGMTSAAGAPGQVPMAKPMGPGYAQSNPLHQHQQPQVMYGQPLAGAGYPPQQGAYAPAQPLHGDPHKVEL